MVSTSAKAAADDSSVLREAPSLPYGGDYRGVFSGRSRELGRAAQNFVMAFVLSLVAAEWPFADFLMTGAAANRFFATAMHDYGTPSWAASVTRHFVRPEYGWALWSGLGIAMLWAAISVWLGLLLGDWMRKIQR